MKKPLIYVAGPYTKGDAVINVRRVICAGEELIAQGFAVFLPHLNHFWHFMIPHGYEFWMEQDFQMLYRVDAILVLAGESPGAERETVMAHEHDIPVFYDQAQVVKHFEGAPR